MLNDVAYMHNVNYCTLVFLLDIACNHNRVHDYTISERKECQYIGYECDSYLHFQKGKCADCGTDGSKCKPMDFQLDYWDEFNPNEKPLPKFATNFYLKTSDKDPFCLFHYQILVSYNGFFLNLILL